MWYTRPEKSRRSRYADGGIRMGLGDGLVIPKQIIRLFAVASFHAWARRRGCSLFLSRESRCHLSELEYRRIGGRFSQPVAAPATPAERTALIYSGTNPAVILSTSTMLERLPGFRRASLSHRGQRNDARAIVFRSPPPLHRMESCSLRSRSLCFSSCLVKARSH